MLLNWRYCSPSICYSFIDEEYLTFSSFKALHYGLILQAGRGTRLKTFNKKGDTSLLFGRMVSKADLLFTLARDEET